MPTAEAADRPTPTRGGNQHLGYTIPPQGSYGSRSWIETNLSGAATNRPTQLNEQKV